METDSNAVTVMLVQTYTGSKTHSFLLFANSFIYTFADKPDGI